MDRAGPEVPRLTTRFLGYRVAGAVVVAAACAFLGSAIGLAMTDGSDGWAELGAGIRGLLLGAGLGVLAGVGFALARPPAEARARWLVLGGLVAAAGLALILLEWLD